MLKHKRWCSFAAALALTAALILPVGAADPLSDSFASLLIYAEATDTPTLNLQVGLYRRDASNAFQLDDSVRYDCSVNRAAGQTDLCIQPQTDGVWAEVEYLTDLNGDGVYEMLDGESNPIRDCITASGELHRRTGEPHFLTKGQTYLLSADTLAARGAEILKLRSTPGSEEALPTAGGALPRQDSMLYFITLHYDSPVDHQEYVLHYYLRHYSSVIVPSDVSPSAWYYDAVEYALEHQFFSGTGADSFSPGGTVTRAQLAQILWRMGGSLTGGDPGLSDAAPGDWYYNAVSWCAQAGLMSGSGSGFLPNNALTREQFALVLRQYAQYAGLEVSGGAALSQFTDGASASVWARDGLEWAVAQGLLSGYSDGSLRPGSSISRAELAAVLRSFCLNTLAP